MNSGSPLRGRWAALALAAIVPFAGCSKKLSNGGGVMDSFFYDVLKMDRGTQYYYETVQQAHDPKNFCYRCTPDPYLADKCVDAIVHLGGAQYARIEGKAQVVLLLSEVVLEDPAALARSEAATSLAKLGQGLEVPPGTSKPDNGARYLEIIKQLDGMHDANGRRYGDTSDARAAVASLIDEIGTLEFPPTDLLTAKNGLKFFPSRPFVVNETDPAIRAAIDRAITRRASALVHASLVAAVEDRMSHVRIDAVNGLRDLKAAEAMDAVKSRLATESNARVRMAMAGYFATIGGADAARSLVALLDDTDGSVRHQARTGLTALAGQDLGKRTDTWVAWVDRRFPPVTPAPEASPAGPTPEGAEPGSHARVVPTPSGAAR